MFPFNYMLNSKFSLSRHFEYANKQITYHFWLWPWKDPLGLRQQENQTMHRFEQYLKILQLYHENSRFPPSFKF
jgi:hypothetical protein